MPRAGLGIDAPPRKTPGRREGEQRTCMDAQEAAIRKLICDKTPDPLTMPFARWNRAAVGQLVQALLGIKLPVRAVGNSLQRWGFAPQTTITKAYEQRPEAVRRGLDEQYRAIAVRAKREFGLIQVNNGGINEMAVARPRLGAGQQCWPQYPNAHRFLGPVTGELAAAA